jgi:hypothetical protein
MVEIAKLRVRAPDPVVGLVGVRLADEERRELERDPVERDRLQQPQRQELLRVSPRRVGHDR